MELKNYITTWSKLHWSPNAPQSYTIDRGGEARGLGKLAYKDLSAFNLAWVACKDTLSTLDGQRKAVEVWAEVNGLGLDDEVKLAICMDEHNWYANIKDTIDRSARATLKKYTSSQSVQ